MFVEKYQVLLKLMSCERLTSTGVLEFNTILNYVVVNMYFSNKLYYFFTVNILHKCNTLRIKYALNHKNIFSFCIAK